MEKAQPKAALEAQHLWEFLKNVGFENLPREEVRLWSYKKRLEAQIYGSEVSMAANDHPVKPRKPKWWKSEW